MSIKVEQQMSHHHHHQHHHNHQQQQQHYSSHSSSPQSSPTKQSNGGGSFGPINDVGDGTYTVSFSGTIAGKATISATIGGKALLSTAPSVSVTPGQQDLAKSTITVSAPSLALGLPPKSARR